MLDVRFLGKWSRWIHRGEVRSADMCLGIVGHRVTETLGMI